MALPNTQTRNPLERSPIPLAPDNRAKKGPGARYTPGARVGPDVQVPRVGPSPQSNRSAALENAPVTINRGEGTKTREVSRDGLTTDLESGGRGPGFA